MQLGPLMRSLSGRLSKAFHRESGGLARTTRRTAHTVRATRVFITTENRARTALLLGAVAAPLLLTSASEEQGPEDEYDRPFYSTPEADDLDTVPYSLSGLGPYVDKLVERSPTLVAAVHELHESGWHFGYLDHHWNTGLTDHDHKIIYLETQLKNDPEYAFLVFAHEVGHARAGAFNWEHTPPDHSMTQEQ